MSGKRKRIKLEDLNIESLLGPPERPLFGWHNLSTNIEKRSLGGLANLERKEKWERS